MSCEFTDGLLRRWLGSQIGDGYIRSALGKCQGDGAADTLGRSGDEHGFSLEQLVHKCEMRTVCGNTWVWRLLWSCLWRGRWCRRLGCRCRGMDRLGLLHPGFSSCRFALVVFVGRYLLLRANHGDGNLTAGFVHLVLL